MLLFLHFILGIITSFLGSLAPGMLNMTATKISLKNGKIQAIKFALGVSIIVFVQAYIAVIFTRYLRANPVFVNSLQKIALLIFFILSFYFYRQYKKDKSQIKSTKNKAYKNTFLVGIFLSSLNMFSIPFYCGITTALDVAGWLQFSRKYIFSFVLGSAIGTFLLLYIYLKYAYFIELKSKGLSKNLNLILSILTGVIGFITLLKVL